MTRAAREDDMATFVIGFGIVLLSAAGLGVGLLVRGRPLRARCRGTPRGTACDTCATNSGRSV